MYTKCNYTYMSTNLSTILSTILSTTLNTTLNTILSKILNFNQLTSKTYRFIIKINSFVIIIFKIKCYMRRNRFIDFFKKFYSWFFVYFMSWRR